MNPTLLIIYILFIHFIGDFVLQTNEMATQKSTSMAWLTLHIEAYASAMFVLTLPVLGFSNAIIYTIVNSLAHFLVDAVTSRITSYYWKQNRTHAFFVTIGADQFIHFATLILTLSLLK